MRYKSLELVNYIGIANGLGLNKIYIDFTKCKHRIVVLVGDNGSGKSTIFQALTVLQNTSDMFIPGMDAVKVIEVIDDETGAVYKIRYEHTAKKDKGYSTKGFIYKTLGDTTINMNEQGNITSCKDIIYSELNLDANFIALSQLSSDDKGLASKTPAERKRFASSIIYTMEVYNNIHKVISKRSSVFKSMINATTSKIDRLGDEALLSSSLVSICNRISTMTEKRTAEVEALGSQKAVVIQLDPTGSIRDSYQTINTDISNMANERSILESKIITMHNNLGMTNVTQEDHRIIGSKIVALQADLANKESEITRLLTERETESSQLQSKIARLNSLQSETNYITMKKLLSDYETKIKEYEAFFNEIGLKDFSLTKDEYVIGLNTLKDIKSTVDVFREAIDYDTMQIALSKFIPNSLYPDKDTLMDAISGMEQYIIKCKEDLIYFNGQLQVSSKLSMRPNECLIDSCNFIKDAVLAATEEPEKNIEFLEVEIAGTEQLLADKYKELEYTNNIISCINYFKVLFRNIESYASILKKLPNGDIFSNKDVFVSKLLSGSTFDEINDIYQYITQASIVEDYNRISKAIISLRSDVQIYESKNDLIEEIRSDIDSLNVKVNSLSNQILNNNDIIFRLKQSIDECTSKELSIKTLLDIYALRDKLSTDILEAQKNLKLIENSINTIQSSLNQINIISSRIKQMDSDISTLERDRSDIEHSLRLLAEYKEELEMYNAKYDKIETIKFYSSYNTGVQTVFMELYMNKVNKIANQLMSYVLNGRFSLKRWVITEDEFRIPCLGDGGYLNDDISSLSDGETALVSMIISFSLLYQASSKYNILKLDEVDAPLDSSNRRQFILVLEQLMDILHSAQTIMISHNDELNLDMADIILLRVNDANKYMDTRNVGNIIYDYKETA